MDTEIHTCLKAGFRKAFVRNSGGVSDLIALFQGAGDEHDPELIIRDCGYAFKAWILVGNYGVKSPQQIFRVDLKNGPVQSHFSSVKEACKAAMLMDKFIRKRSEA